MKSYPFRLLGDDSLVVVDGLVDGRDVRLAIDTGASHTVVDLTALLIAGYSLSDIKGATQFETAQGIMDAHVFQLKKFEVLGMQLTNFDISSYDFLAYGLVTEFDGMLGLDFFKGKKVCFDFGKSLVSIEASPPANS